MSAYNPYVAPQVAQAPGFPAAQVGYADAYVPLGWRSVMACIGVASVAVLGVGVDVTQMAMGDSLKGESPDLTAALLALAVAVAFMGSLIFAAVFFCVWMHRAAKNLRSLGRTGMTFSPGKSVGGFFIPFINLVRPYKAMAELYRASDSGPESDQNGWTIYGKTTGILGVWWGAWMVGNVITNISSRFDDAGAGGAIGLFAGGFIASAAVLCIVLVRQISAKQQETAARMGSQRV